MIQVKELMIPYNYESMLDLKQKGLSRKAETRVCTDSLEKSVDCLEILV